MEMLIGAVYGWGLLQAAYRLAYRYRQTYAAWWEEDCPPLPEAPIWVQLLAVLVGVTAGVGSRSATEFVVVLVWAGLLLTAAVADAYWFVLPRRYSVAAGLLGLAWAFSRDVWWEAAAATAVLGGLALLLYRLARGGMGAGDVWFAAAAAAWTGPDGALAACWLATLAALLYWLCGRLRGAPVRAIPFGPFLAAAFYAVYWYR